MHDRRRLGDDVSGGEGVMDFEDREEAGRLLGQRLQGMGLEGAVVLGIPRGGVVVAAGVAEALGGELGVIVARKLRAPHQPELAIGAVASDGSFWLEPRALRVLGVDPPYLDAELELQSAEARRREALFAAHSRPSLAGRPVVVVDDGIATGATAMAALRAARAAGATTVVLAAPVASPERADMLRSEADLVVCLVEDPNLYAVGQYYEDFRAIEEDEVMTLLESHGKKPSTERRTSMRGMAARRPSGAGGGPSSV